MVALLVAAEKELNMLACSDEWGPAAIFMEKGITETPKETLEWTLQC